MDAERMDDAVERRDAAYLLDWFKRLFPQFKEPEKGQAAPGSSPATASGEGNGQGASTTAQQEQLEVHKKDAIIVSCPACEGENMILLEQKAEATKLPGDPRKTGVTAIPDSVIRCNDCECDICPKKFHVFVEPLGGRRYAVEASLSRKFREPKKVVEAVDLRADFKENVWQKIVEGKVVGTVGTRPREAEE